MKAHQSRSNEEINENRPSIMLSIFWEENERRRNQSKWKCYIDIYVNNRSGGENENVAVKKNKLRNRHRSGIENRRLHLHHRPRTRNIYIEMKMFTSKSKIIDNQRRKCGGSAARNPGGITREMKWKSSIIGPAYRHINRNNHHIVKNHRQSATSAAEIITAAYRQSAAATLRRSKEKS